MNYFMGAIGVIVAAYGVYSFVKKIIEIKNRTA
jgi:hypothetical protein